MPLRPKKIMVGAVRENPGFDFKQPRRKGALRPSLRANGSRERAPDDRLREAIHRAAQRKNGLLRRSAPRNDVKSRYASAFPRRDAPEVLQEPFAQENRGRRECRARDAPAASRTNEKSTGA